jgi:hypothetical protein
MSQQDNTLPKVWPLPLKSGPLARLAQWALSGLCIAILAKRFLDTDGPSWQDTARAWEFSSGFFLVGAFALMPFNLGLEAARWRLCLTHLGIVSWYWHFRAVLRGIALGIPLTHAVGDYAGKLSLVSGKVPEGVPLLMAASLSQYLSTLLLGISGLYVLLHEGNQWPFLLPFWPIMLAWVGLLSVGYFLLPLIYSFAIRFHLPGLASLPKNVVWPQAWKLLAISCIRTLIILCQYGLLWFFFKPGPNLEIFLAGVGVTLAIKTLMPFFSIGGMVGLRELLLTTVLTPLGYHLLPLVALSLAVWIINVALPALVGSFLVAPKPKIESWKSAS